MADKKVPTCGDCVHADVCARVPYFTGFSRENPAYCGDFKQAQEWIPVSEHEPEIDCITVDDLGQIVLARRISVITLPTKKKIYLANEKAEEIMACLGDGDTLINCTHITHWMPLPKLPNE